MRPPLRLQLLLAFVLPAGIILFFVTQRAERMTRRALEEALEDQLIAVAQAATPLLPSYITALEPGDDDTRTRKNALSKLIELRNAVGARRILVVRNPGDDVLVDTDNIYPVGTPYWRAQIDQSEISQVRKGQSTASILFRTPSNEWFKSGYAPMKVKDTVVAYVVAAAPVTYGEAIDNLRQRLLLLSLAALVMMSVAAVFLADGVARPLQAAQSSGRSHW